MEVVKQNTQEGRELDKLLGSSSPRYNYDRLIAAYNDLAVDDMLKFEYPPASVTNLSTVLRGRGLQRGKDFAAKGGMVEGSDTPQGGTFWVVMKRLSETPGLLSTEVRSKQK